MLIRQNKRNIAHNEMNNLLICGIPRSGTTLIASLIDSADNTVVLSEPNLKNGPPQPFTNKGDFVDRIVREFHDTRSFILEHNKIEDRVSLDQTPLTNYLSRNKEGETVKTYKVEEREIHSISKQFLLGIKRNAGYAAVLEELATSNDFQILLIVRDPIDTILSWRATPFPISKGRLPGGEVLCPKIRGITLSKADVLTKQIKLYELFINRFTTVSRNVTLVHYEDILIEPDILSELLKIDCINNNMIRKKIDRSYIDHSAEVQIRNNFLSIAGDSYKEFIETFPRVY